jgi:hypothetical protein
MRVEREREGAASVGRVGLGGAQAQLTHGHKHPSTRLGYSRS